MSKIDISRNHTLPVEQGRKVLKKFAEELTSKYGGSYSETTEGLTFKGPGIEGQITLDQRVVNLKAKLGLLMGPFKGAIEQQINEKMDEVFANTKK